MSDADPKKQIDASLVVDLRPWRPFVPPPPWMNDTGWSGYGEFPDLEQMNGTVDTREPELVPTLVAEHRSMMTELAERSPALHETVVALAKMSAQIHRLAERSGDPNVLKVAAVLNTTWLACVAHGEGSPALLDQLSSIAQKKLHEEAPRSNHVAPARLRDLARDLIRSLSLYQRFGVIDAGTEQRCRITRYQVACVLARRVLPFVTDPVLREDHELREDRIYMAMPLGLDGPGNGKLTDRDREHLHDEFLENPRRAVAAAFRAIGIATSRANDAVKAIGTRGKARVSEAAGPRVGKKSNSSQVAQG